MSHKVSYSNPFSLLDDDLATLGTATKTIDFAAYSLTHVAIIGKLAARAEAGITVRLYLDRGELEAAARGHNNPALLPIAPLYNLPTVSIKVKSSKILMHLKAYCVDSRIVRDGAGNFSPLGLTSEDNSATFDDDPAALAAFQHKFEAMWTRTDNLSVPIAIAPAEHNLHVMAHSH